MLKAVNISNHQLNSSNIARRKFPLQVLWNMANLVLNGDTGDLLENRHLIRQTNFREAWGMSYENKLGWLTQGMPGWVNGTNTILFIHK